MNLYTTIITLHHFSDAQWLSNLIRQNYIANNTDWKELTQLEWFGDLEEINRVIADEMEQIHEQSENVDLTHRSPFRALENVWKFINAAQEITNPDELIHLPNIKAFEMKYPNLYHTFCTWAWG